MKLHHLAMASRLRRAQAVRRRREREERRARRLMLLASLSLPLFAALALIGLVNLSYGPELADMPQLSSYPAAELAQTSIVYDKDGNEVDELHGVQNRLVVSLKDISPSLQDAVIAVEDHRFYEHSGVDPEGIARAALKDTQGASVRQGGSTITQQLVKNTYIAQEDRQLPSFERKLDEASLAYQYEESHSKSEVLERYLNTVYFGANAYGAEAAAHTYFDKPAKDLTLAEAATLAGIVNLPGAYDPFSDPESTQKRRDVVLGKMLEYGYITHDEHDKAVSEALSPHPDSRQSARGKDDDYFLAAVRAELVKQYGEDALYEGGLKIYTTLDPNLQRLATSSVTRVVDPSQSSGDPSASLVSVEPSTGAVRAMVGGSDYAQAPFNLATQAKRQPGSSFKPFVLAEAIRQGISPESTYTSKNLSIDMGEYAKPYSVKNYDGMERGEISVEKAMAESDNTVFVQFALDLGLDRVAKTANKAGLTTSLDTYPSMAIGGLKEGVTPLEMASAYSTFANEGTHEEPYLVESVTKNATGGEQKTIEQHTPIASQPLSKDEAAAVTQVLKGVVERGTASRYRNLDYELGRPSAGKTGTTEEFSDAWYVGYVPQLATSVWVGYPDERKPMVNVRGLPEVNGENFPLDIFSGYMQGALQGLPKKELDSPSSDLKLQRKKGADPSTREPKTAGSKESTSSPEKTGP